MLWHGEASDGNKFESQFEKQSGGTIDGKLEIKFEGQCEGEINDKLESHESKHEHDIVNNIESRRSGYEDEATKEEHAT